MSIASGTTVSSRLPASSTSVTGQGCCCRRSRTSDRSHALQHNRQGWWVCTLASQPDRSLSNLKRGANTRPVSSESTTHTRNLLNPPRLMQQ
eukprot:3194323-Rhodomonas_salina.1